MLNKLTDSQINFSRALSNSTPKRTDVSSLSPTQQNVKKVLDFVGVFLLSIFIFPIYFQIRCGCAFASAFAVVVGKQPTQIISPLSGEVIDVTPAGWGEMAATLLTCKIFSFLIERE